MRVCLTVKGEDAVLDSRDAALETSLRSQSCASFFFFFAFVVALLLPVVLRAI